MVVGARMSGIELNDVWFQYGRAPALLRGLSLSAPPGEILGVVGENGAGKTTLFRLVAGLLEPRSGRLEVAGINVRTERREASRRLGFVPDEPLVYPRLSALENLARFALLWGVPKGQAKSRAEALLREAELWDARDQWAESYSRGMRQRLSLCCALLHSPSVLLLDEPFNGLDLGAGLWLRGVLRRHAEEGGCVVLSSHQPEALDALADRLALLQDGRAEQTFDRRQLAQEGGAEAVFLRARTQASGAPQDTGAAR